MKDKHKMLHDIAMYDGAVLKELRGERVYKVRHKNSYLHVDQLLYAVSLDWLMPVATKLCGQLIVEGDHAIAPIHHALLVPPDADGQYTDLLEAIHEAVSKLEKPIREIPVPAADKTQNDDEHITEKAVDFISLKAAELELRMRSEIVRSMRECVAWAAKQQRGTIGELTNPVQPVPDGPTEDEIRVKSIYGDAFLHVMQSTGTCMVMADPHLRNELEPISKVSRDGIEAWSSAAHRLEISGLLKVVKAD